MPGSQAPSNASAVGSALDNSAAFTEVIFTHGTTGTDKPRRLLSASDGPDIAFKWIARGSGTIVVTVMSLVGLFLLYQGFQALQVAGPSFLTEQSWDPNSGKFGIAAVLAGTFLIALTAISFALPLSLGTALYISEYAPAKIK
ncbi:MAG: phosphate ABC transporter permease subunit PstC, partial [Candidatus Saccharibacteria bacterium]|nr:phosphate ABC transporter permease subunit PstC [Microbacteriaceae bacterium]